MNVNRRQRRTPEEARTLILDTAEARLAEHGLEGLNIVGVAEAAGISHATLIHHFGSSAGMRRALVERMSERLIQEAVGAIGNHREIHAVFQHLFAVFSTGGHAKLLAWLAIEATQQPAPNAERQAQFRELIEACAAGLPEQDLESARNLVTLVVAAAIGLGVAGEPLLRLVGMDAQGRRRFPHWLADRVGVAGD